MGVWLTIMILKKIRKNTQHTQHTKRNHENNTPKRKGDNKMKQQVLDCFAKLFGGEGDIRTYFAPGRVNLIGEHTDYNGGHVFPCALTIGTYMAARKRDDRKLRFYSMNFEKLGVVESSLDEFLMGKEGNWTAYPKGMI